MSTVRSSKFYSNREKLLKQHKCCEKCGRTIGLEVHHKIPVIEGGSDELDNLQVLCDICHDDIHKYNRSDLIKEGLEKSRHSHKVVELLISKYAFYMKLQNLLDEGETPDVIDILDIIDSLPTTYGKELKN